VLLFSCVYIDKQCSYRLTQAIRIRVLKCIDLYGKHCSIIQEITIPRNQAIATNSQGRREGGIRGGSYPGPRSIGGAPRSLRMIYLLPFTANTKADNSKSFN